MLSMQERTKLFQAKVAAMIKPSISSSSVDSAVPRTEASVNEEEAEPQPTNEKNEIKPSSYGMRPKYSAVNINADKWLLTMDEESRAKLENPPSLADGIDRETEEDLRYLGCELIQSGSILLKLPQTAAATGQILFQRFYYQKSFALFHFEHAVMACLLLASKIEEAPRRARDVINVFQRLEQLHRLKRSSSRPITREQTAKLLPRALDAKYVQTKQQMLKTERRILVSLGFVVHVKHPHKLILSYIHTLCLTDNKELVQRAWSYMNDGLRTDIFLRYTPETIASACIFLAARTIEHPISLPTTPFPWFELFDASDRDVEAIALMLLRLYRRKPVNWNGLNLLLEKVHDEKMKEKNAVKAAEVAKKLTEEGQKRNGDSNGRERSRSRSPSRHRSPRRRRESPNDRRRGRDDRRDRERRDKEKDKGRKDDRRNERKRSRNSNTEQHRAKERSRQREKEVYQALGKRQRELSPPPAKYRK